MAASDGKAPSEDLVREVSIMMAHSRGATDSQLYAMLLAGDEVEFLMDDSDEESGAADTAGGPRTREASSTASKPSPFAGVTPREVAAAAAVVRQKRLAATAEAAGKRTREAAARAAAAEQGGDSGASSTDGADGVGGGAGSSGPGAEEGPPLAKAEGGGSASDRSPITIGSDPQIRVRRSRAVVDFGTSGASAAGGALLPGEGSFEGEVVYRTDLAAPDGGGGASEVRVAAQVQRIAAARLKGTLRRDLRVYAELRKAGMWSPHVLQFLATAEHLGPELHAGADVAAVSGAGAAAGATDGEVGRFWAIAREAHDGPLWDWLTRPGPAAAGAAATGAMGGAGGSGASGGSPAGGIRCYEERLELVRQLFDGIAFLHANGLLHNNLGADNVLVRDGSVKIADFALSRPGVAHGGVTVLPTATSAAATAQSLLSVSVVARAVTADNPFSVADVDGFSGSRRSDVFAAACMAGCILALADERMPKGVGATPEAAMEARRVAFLRGHPYAPEGGPSSTSADNSARFAKDIKVAFSDAREALGRGKDDTIVNVSPSDDRKKYRRLIRGAFADDLGVGCGAETWVTNLCGSKDPELCAPVPASDWLAGVPAHDRELVRDLIEHAAHPAVAARPYARDCVRHPLFWDASTRMRFLCLFSEHFPGWPTHKKTNVRDELCDAWDDYVAAADVMPRPEAQEPQGTRSVAFWKRTWLGRVWHRDGSTDWHDGAWADHVDDATELPSDPEALARMNTYQTATPPPQVQKCWASYCDPTHNCPAMELVRTLRNVFEHAPRYVRDGFFKNTDDAAKFVQTRFPWLVVTAWRFVERERASRPSLARVFDAFYDADSLAAARHTADVEQLRRRNKELEARVAQLEAEISKTGGGSAAGPGGDGGGDSGHK